METLGLLTSTNKYQNLQTMVTPPPPSHLSSLVYLIVGQSWMRLFVFCLFLNLFLNFDSRICHTLLSSWCKIKMSTEISIKYIWRTRKFWGSNNCYHCKHLTSFKKKKRHLFVIRFMRNCSEGWIFLTASFLILQCVTTLFSFTLCTSALSCLLPLFPPLPTLFVGEIWQLCLFSLVAGSF